MASSNSGRLSAVVFAYHDVGVRCLGVLLARGIRVSLVVTHVDDPSEIRWFGSVAEFSQDHGIPFIQPTSNPKKDNDLLARVASLQPDFIFSFYYRYMLPVSLLSLASRGAYNMHGSLLPKYRGRAPVNWAILNGETETGVTLHEMVSKPDAGPIVAQSDPIPILPDDTAHQVFQKVTVAAEQTLWNVLPLMKEGKTSKRANELSEGSYFGGRKPEDGMIDWSCSAVEVYNLHRAVAPPHYPGAWTLAGGRKYIIGKARPGSHTSSTKPAQGCLGLDIVDGRILGRCGDEQIIEIHELLDEGGRIVLPHALREVLQLSSASEPNPAGRLPSLSGPQPTVKKRILILGVDGFIGHHLARRILSDAAYTDWVIYGLDLADSRLRACPLLRSHLVTLKNDGDAKCNSGRLFFRQGDMQSESTWIDDQVRNSDVVLPLAGIACPQSYISDPLSIFEVDFAAQLPIIEACVRYKKRLIFPSTSEVYGMPLSSQSPTAGTGVLRVNNSSCEMDADESPLVYGPTTKSRWIYATCKQLLDRIIHAHGIQNGLDYTLFRPFNWFGPGLDDLPRPTPHHSSHTETGLSTGGDIDTGRAHKNGTIGGNTVRVTTQFLLQILKGEDIVLCNGGRQRRTFTYIDDGIDALLKIIENKGGVASGRIYNIGGDIQSSNCSIRELGEMMLRLYREHQTHCHGPADGVSGEVNPGKDRSRLVEMSGEEVYGKGYQDVDNRVPDIKKTCEELDWRPRTSLEEGLRRIIGTAADASPRGSGAN
ncbi:Bifunctional polymyxin resistance protein ArnA [Madurella mycetomatis]|uniref:Bifunctional polymyxin resistance protein ArnA n=1 Tax=Madurella mycetomatis TaxID=100816 RepID=A0A175W195_9PEZI|nr:Bifunctional polymyxin resistance protein ArnA [Madurella mycetomatis]